MNLYLCVCISIWEKPEDKSIYKTGHLTDNADVHIALYWDKFLKSLASDLGSSEKGFLGIRYLWKTTWIILRAKHSVIMLSNCLKYQKLSNIINFILVVFQFYAFILLGETNMSTNIEATEDSIYFWQNDY